MPPPTHTWNKASISDVFALNHRQVSAPGQENRMDWFMGIIVWLVVGGICGWLASLLMRTDAQ